MFPKALSFEACACMLLCMQCIKCFGKVVWYHVWYHVCYKGAAFTVITSWHWQMSTYFFYISLHFIFVLYTHTKIHCIQSLFLFCVVEIFILMWRMRSSFLLYFTLPDDGFLSKTKHVAINCTQDTIKCNCDWLPLLLSYCVYMTMGCST